MVNLSRGNNRRTVFRISGYVDVIGNRLRFEAKPSATAVLMSFFPRLIESVSRIELHGGHIGITFHFDSALGAV